MAGFIFTIKDDEKLLNLTNCFLYGRYSTKFNKEPASTAPFCGTLADYCTMNEGDNIYFFHDRKIYGIGVLKKVGIDCKIKNYLDSCKIIHKYIKLDKDYILNEKEDLDNYHWICFFEPSPHFYKDGLDMDDILSYKPETIKGLRTMWKKSFIKIDDEENDTIKELLYLRNYNKSSFFTFNKSRQSEIESRITDEYKISMKDVLQEYKKEDKITIESALEGGILECLANKKHPEILGERNYINHQICASPFKPIDYMDRIDIFAYNSKTVCGTRIVTKYLVIELKADEADNDSVTQILKYVDFISKNYAYGDYSLIEAKIIAYDFSKVDIAKAKEISKREYLISSHPVVSRFWDNLELIKYKYTDEFEFDLI